MTSLDADRTTGRPGGETASGMRAAPTMAVAVLYLAIAVPLAVTLNLWRDECYSLATTALPLREIAQRAITFEQQPPLYFVLLGLWRAIDAAPVFARLLSVLCGLLTMLIVARLSIRFAPSVPPALTAALVAFNPWLILAAVEIRPYALAILWSALLMLTFSDAFLPDDATPEPWRLRPGRIVRFAVVALAALYTQYYLGFILLAAGVGLLVLRDWRRVRAYVAGMVAVAICAIPIIGWLPAQIASNVPPTTGHPGLGEIARYGLALFRYIAPIRTPHHERWIAVFAMLPAAAILLPGARRRYFGRPHNVWLFAFALVLSIIIAVLRTKLPAATLNPTHTLFLLVPGIVMFVSVLAAAAPRALVGVSCAVLLLYDGLALVQEYGPLAKLGDAQRVAQYLAHHEHPGEPIFVVPNENVMPLRWYYHGPNELVPLPGEPSVTTFSIPSLAIPNVDTVAAAITRHAHGGPFWVYREPVPTYMGVSFGPEYLTQYLSAHDSATEHRDFYGGVSVTRYTPR